jgi:sucrose-6-phosphate hydrolase SacC (GH32 family)
MFSGGAFVSKHGPAMIYHGWGADTNYVVIAEDDDLEQWSDPIPAIPDVRPDQDGSRIHPGDPDAWLEGGDTYYAIFGGTALKEGTVPTYFRSSDLRRWDYLGLFLDPDLPETADDIDVSCPSFFPIGNKHMLLCISHNLGARYYLGEWKDERFTPEFHARMNWRERDFFAPESLLTPDGRRVMWAWAWVDWVGVEAPQSGIQSLPRELELPDDGVLRIRPLRELESLRAHERRQHGITVTDGVRLVPGVVGNALELAVTIRPATARRFGVLVHADRHAAGGIPVTVDLNAGTFAVGGTVATFVVQPDEPVQLRIFIDKFLIEAFADDRQAVLFSDTEGAANIHVAIFAETGEAVADVVAWDLRSIYDSPHA